MTLLRVEVVIMLNLGMQDARVFCKSHQLNAVDTNLVASLVEKHLLMSVVAQKQDIDDPVVIKTFVKQLDLWSF